MIFFPETPDALATARLVCASFYDRAAPGEVRLMDSLVRARSLLNRLRNETPDSFWALRGDLRPDVGAAERRFDYAVKAVRRCRRFARLPCDEQSAIAAALFAPPGDVSKERLRRAS